MFLRKVRNRFRNDKKEYLIHEKATSLLNEVAL